MDPRAYEKILEDKFAKRFDKDRWYYSIELKPGFYTPGGNYKNIALTRKLLSRCDIQGLDCLDVACADGLIPTLMHRRGARHVVGCDRNDFGMKIRQLKARLGLEMEYNPLVTQQQIVDLSNKSERLGFDVVVNSGLLYHVFNTLGTMCLSRSLVRTDGIMIVETAGSSLNTYAEFFNAAGRMSPTDPTTFWYVTIKMMEYYGRMLRLEPIDAVFGPITENETKSLRFAIAFRATADYPAKPEDKWVQRTFEARDYMDLIDWSVLDHATTKPVGYDAPADLPSTGRGIDTMALLNQIGTYDAPLDEVRLPLGVTV
ncbi:DUF1698 domain-containing protein [Mesorhizobium sp. CGMCC 1.15528]|uniref:DUF1698 domain-containing protein n=1 Tax=Mesorhizobium zhangyense TaxID=1776730 RepID=A0A7C9RF81_9HYPH|nr:methyltransferase domain-containing protein [Mesorhizobium zhangyense]NGN45193.1 DUF1698 domain-containing protein [Mesorhizobium zhangyense]